MSSIRITPLHTGTLKRNAAGMIMGAAPRPMDLAILMFLVQTPDKTVLVDTGTRNPAETVPLHNPYEQTVRAIRNIERALQALGASLDDVVRTRMFVTDISRWQEFGRAHGEFFGKTRPCTTMVEVRRLIDDRMLVEIEADALMGAADAEPG